LPYSVAAADRLIDETNAHDLAFVVHVGDIGHSQPAQACGEAWLKARKQQFSRSRSAVGLPGSAEASPRK
jgi:hypothetical protein